MKTNNNVWCYLGIVFLLIFTILPPALRIFVPKKEDPADKIVVKKILKCSSTEYIINSSYEDGKLGIFAIKQLSAEPIKESDEEKEETESTDTNETDSTTESNQNDKTETNKNDNQVDTNHKKDDDTKKSEIDKLFDEIEDSHKGEIITQVDGKIFTSDYSLETPNFAYFEKISRSLEMQKIFYETQGLTCSIM